MLDKDKAICLNILEAINKIMDITHGFSNCDDLKSNYIHFDATMMNLIVIGEMANKLSNEFKEDTAHIDWRKISALRNIIAHDYFGVDEEEIWQIIQNKLPALKIGIEMIISQPF
jgi:uncharacterized protein with HEPN domain